MGRWKKANVIRGNKYGAAAPTGGGFLGKKRAHIPSARRGQIVYHRNSIKSTVPRYGPDSLVPLKNTKDDAKKWGRSREHVPLTLLAYGLNAAAHTGQTRRAWVDFSGFLVMGIPFLPHQGRGIGGARVCDSGRSG